MIQLLVILFVFAIAHIVAFQPSEPFYLIEETRYLMTPKQTRQTLAILGYPRPLDQIEEEMTKYDVYYLLILFSLLEAQVGMDFFLHRVLDGEGKESG